MDCAATGLPIDSAQIAQTFAAIAALEIGQRTLADHGVWTRGSTALADSAGRLGRGAARACRLGGPAKMDEVGGVSLNQVSEAAGAVRPAEHAHQLAPEHFLGRFDEDQIQMDTRVTIGSPYPLTYALQVLWPSHPDLFKPIRSQMEMHLARLAYLVIIPAIAAILSLAAKLGMVLLEGVVRIVWTALPRLCLGRMMFWDAKAAATQMSWANTHHKMLSNTSASPCRRLIANKGISAIPH